MSRLTDFFRNIKKSNEKQPPSTEGAKQSSAGPVVSPGRPCPDKGPWVAQEWAPGVVVLHSEDPDYQVVMQLSGEFRSHAHQLAYAQSLASWMNHHLPEPEPLAVPPEPFVAEGDSPILDGATNDRPEPEVPVAKEEKPRTKLLGNKLSRLQKKNMQKREPLTPKIETTPVPPVTAEPKEPTIAPSTAQATYSVAAPAPQPAQVAKEEECAPQPKTAQAESPATPYGCHCELTEGMQPDACAIDIGQPEACAYALEGIQKNDCFFWRPITLYPTQHASRTASHE